MVGGGGGVEKISLWTSRCWQQKKLHWKIVVQEGVLLFPLDMALLGSALVLSESDMLNVLLLFEKCLQYKWQIASERWVVSFQYMLIYSNCSSVSVNAQNGMESSIVVLITVAFAKVKNALNYCHWIQESFLNSENIYWVCDVIFMKSFFRWELQFRKNWLLL